MILMSLQRITSVYIATYGTYLYRQVALLIVKWFTSFLNRRRDFQLDLLLINICRLLNKMYKMCVHIYARLFRSDRTTFVHTYLYNLFEFI